MKNTFKLSTFEGNSPSFYELRAIPFKKRVTHFFEYSLLRKTGSHLLPLSSSHLLSAPLPFSFRL